MWFQVVFLPLLFEITVESASLFDAITASIGSLFTEQEEAPFTASRRQFKGFEERSYGALSWVCAQRTNMDEAEQKEQETFLQLFSYLEGDNEAGVNIDMAIPVSVEYLSVNDSISLQPCFYLGERYHGNAPAPTNRNLSISKTEPMTIYTRKVSGFFTKPSQWLREAKKLQDVISKEGKATRKDRMFWNAFDSPAKLWNRRNEVWLMKEE